MKVCPKCDKACANTDIRCGFCGSSIIREPITLGMSEFRNPGSEIMEKVHKKHRILNLKVTIVLSVIVQLLLASTFGFVHDWTLIVHAVFAVGMALFLHKVKSDQLLATVVSGIGCVVIYYITDHLGIHAFLSLWILSFWYGILGYAIQSNNEMHGGQTSV